MWEAACTLCCLCAHIIRLKHTHTHAGKIAGKSFVLQGFGNVGGWAADMLHAQGGKGARVCCVVCVHACSSVDTSMLCRV